MRPSTSCRSAADASLSAAGSWGRYPGRPSETAWLSMSAADEQARRSEVLEWIAMADEDLEVARRCLSTDAAIIGAAAYHCQQAAEKLIKAGLIAHGRAFRNTHDLEELADALAAAVPSLTASLAPVRPLTFWNFAFRDPMPTRDETPPSAGELTAILEDISRLRSELLTATGVATT